MRNGVSFENLNPAAFLERSALVWPGKPAVMYGGLTYSYAEFHERVRRLAGALRGLGVGRGDRVAVLLPNTPAMLEAKFGPLRLGAVLVALNTRLAPREIAYILNHCGARALIFDAQFAEKVSALAADCPQVESFVRVEDGAHGGGDGGVAGPEYEALLRAAEPVEEVVEIDEREAIAVNYTSGTTGFPKGVVLHARGAYLNALGEALETGMNAETVYLWTLPLFHCNGWCFPWGVTAVGGTHVCLRRIDPAEIYRLIEARGVTHLCCAPTVLTALYSAEEARGRRLDGVAIVTAGAPPAPRVIRAMEGMGARVHHVYGLTETYGPHTICAEQPAWRGLDAAERSRVKARQGVPYGIAHDGLRVVDGAMREVPWDGETLGEAVMRGNNVMSGYYNDPQATEQAFAGGWFHSGDLAVRHPDGYIELRDRAKDIIISGGENISSQEVEKTIMEHPDVLEVSVIGVPDAKWGEVPKAFVVPAPGAALSAEQVIAFARERMAHFKCPKHVEFGDLPKTATGKIRKFVLRARGARNTVESGE